jgi:hypothetical protein
MSDQLFESSVTLAVHAGIAFVILGLITRWTKLDYQKALAIIGAIGISLFVACIGIPFFFQGYADSSVVHGDVPLGWTRNPVIGLFAYLYTFKWMGFAWLSTSISCVAAGRFSRKAIVDILAKSALVLMACIMLTQLDAFAETINVVLE